MEILDIFVYLFGFLSVLSGLGVVLSKKSLNSAIWLVVTMVLIAAQFALMRADFIAAVQILVYAGAIMILVVFVIMLLGVERDAEKVKYPVPAYVGFIFAGIFIGVIFTIFNSYENLPIGISEKNLSNELSNSANNESSDRSGAVYKLGHYLLGDHLIAFQASGVLLLAAIIGAALLSFPKERPLLPGRGLKAVREKFNSEKLNSEEKEA